MIKARHTKDEIVQFRMSGADKRALQQYAESQGITLSDLSRRTMVALVKVIQQKPRPTGQGADSAEAIASWGGIRSVK